MSTSLDSLYKLAQTLEAAETAGITEVVVTLDIEQARLLRRLATDYVESAQEAEREIAL